MKRRDFIRVMGGGIALAATAGGMSACSTRYPDAVLEAWNGPDDALGLPMWAVAYAILAPSSHNRQPWLVDLRESNSISLHVDRERMLPMTDPWFRQITVSQGAFIESLLIALKERGVAPQLQLFPEGEFAPREVDDRPVARIIWESRSATLAKDSLFPQLLRRQTAKVAYDTARPVAESVLEQLRSAVAGFEVGFGGTVSADRVAPLRSLCLDAAKVEINTGRTIMESTRLMRIGPEEISRHRDGISINELVPRIADALGAFDRSQPPAEGSVGYNKAIERFEQHSLSAMGFVWLTTASARHLAVGSSRSAEVNAGRAYIRLQLKATELGLQMHPMSQAPQEFEEMKPHYDHLHQLLLGRPAAEETIQMFCRIGYCENQQHSPRRSLKDFVKT
ncbi:MAG: hypothetical protein K9J42_15900 [Sulfuritalea sp.]|nr:hypothetical protein [Sulfuritalea sp.]